MERVIGDGHGAALVRAQRVAREPFDVAIDAAILAVALAVYPDSRRRGEVRQSRL
jgi:hypothetical protein